MINEVSATIAILMLEIRIPEAQSLKVKRKSIKSFIESVQSKYKVSIAEIGAQDKWQRSVIGVTMISNDSVLVNRIMQAIRERLYQYPEMELVDSRLELL